MVVHSPTAIRPDSTKPSPGNGRRSFLLREPSITLYASMDISVVGAGAMGCLFGARLAEGGHRVTLIDVRADHVDAIRRHGLIVEEDGKERVVRLEATVPD